MPSPSAFDYAIPYDIMVGYWVGIANVFGPKGTYAVSTKSHLSIYWLEPFKLLHFREAGEDHAAFDGTAHACVDPRKVEHPAAPVASSLGSLEIVRSLRALHYDFLVDGPYCESMGNPEVSVKGVQTRPDVYIFHVKKREPAGGYHHFYNSHRISGPNEWQIIGPIVGPDGEVGANIVQTFQRVSYEIPKSFVRDFHD